MEVTALRCDRWELWPPAPPFPAKRLCMCHKLIWGKTTQVLVCRLLSKSAAARLHTCRLNDTWSSGSDQKWGAADIWLNHLKWRGTSHTEEGAREFKGRVENTDFNRGDVVQRYGLDCEILTGLGNCARNSPWRGISLSPASDGVEFSSGSEGDTRPPCVPSVRPRCGIQIRVRYP